MLTTNSRCRLYLLIMLAALAAAAFGADWPQFQGPDRNGISPETGLARHWPEHGPAVRWSVKSTLGTGGMAVSGKEVYFLEQDQASKQTVLRCVLLATGAESWRFTFAAQKSDYGALSTPSVDRRSVFVIGSGGEMHCLDRRTHRSRWTVDLLADFHGKSAEWGVSQSPLLYKDLVIVAPQSPEAGVVALEKGSGNVAWKSDPIGVMGYVSPYLTVIDGVEQLIMIGKGGVGDNTAVHPTVVGIDPANGHTLWKYTGWRDDNPIPWPTPLGDGRFFFCAWYSATGTMIKVARQGEQWNVSELYSGKSFMSIIQHTLYYDGYLYVSYNGLNCIAPDGTLKWQTAGKPKFGCGNFLIADHLIYSMDSDSGQLYLVEATPDGYHELGRAQVLEGKDIYMPMALAYGNLLVRDRQQIKCLEVK